MVLPTNINGFTVLPVLYNSSATHYLYVRAHSSSDKRSKESDVLPEGRTLFLVNVPPDATERELILFFKHAGTVERVVFGFSNLDSQHDLNNESSEEDEEDAGSMDEDSDSDESGHANGRKKKQDDKPSIVSLSASNPPIRKLRKTGRSAHILFLDPSSLERALASTSRPRPWPCKPSAEQLPSEEAVGLARYQAIYTTLRPPLPTVQAFADSYMEVYEYKLAKEKQNSKYKKGEAVVDEDGFTLVTRGGAYGKTLGGGVGVASKKFQRSIGQSRSRGKSGPDKKSAKEGFYAFQKAEKQRSELMELKRKWEEDKAKVEKLKASRRFKPY